jgi:PPK2 family polyphosphate:nucleotide phosphotransferase
MPEPADAPDIDWRALAVACRVTPGSTVSLERDFDPARKDPSLDKDRGHAALRVAVDALADLQDRFYAQGDRSLLVVLQAIDAAGKDSTIKHVMSGVNPQGVNVHSYKAPSTFERSHGYLWRHQAGLPARGHISIFNRSHYENVLIVRVHPHLIWPKPPGGIDTSDPDVLDDLWQRRYREINDWERYLVDSGTDIVKLFLHVSKDEQKKRFLSRIDDPTKNWKFAVDDLHERDHWPQYQAAFEDMLTHTSTEWAPWYVIPADAKWFSRLSTSAVLLETLRRIDPRYPTLDDDERAELQVARRQLLDD